MKKLFPFRIIIFAASLLLQLSTLCFQSRGAAGDVDLSFDPGSSVNGRVTDVLVQPDGTVLIAGSFTTVKGLARTNLARLHADGSGDATFMAPPIGKVTALAWQPDGKLLVGDLVNQTICDEFDCYGYSVASVVRLNANGSRDTSFTPATAEHRFEELSDFRSLVLQPDGRILVGGNFHFINSTNRMFIARLNANGTLDTSFNTGAGPDHAVSSIALQPDGSMLIAGSFSTVDGTNRNGVARLNANGTLDPAFDAGFVLVQYPDCGPLYSCFKSTDITALALQPDGKVLVGVSTRLSQQSLDDGQVQIADQILVQRLHADGSPDPGFVFTNSVALVRSILVQPDGKLLVRHGFTWSGINRLNANGSWDLSFNVSTEGDSVDAVALQADGKILIGGPITSVHGTNRNRLARLNSDGTLDLTFDPGQGLKWAVSQVALQPDGKVLIGGVFAFINGTNRYGSARLNGDGSLDHGFVSTPYDPSLTAFYHLEDCPGDSLYVCFQSVVTMAHLVQTDGKVLISGYSFSTILAEDPYTQNYHSFLGRFTATGGLEEAFNLPNSYVTAMAQQSDGKIVIAGDLFLNGTNTTVARLNPNGSVDASFQLGHGPMSASCLALQADGKIVVGYANGVIRLQNNGSRDPGFDPVAASNGSVACLALQSDGRVLIVGSFTSVNGTNRNHIARLNADGSLDSSFNPGTGADGLVRSIALQSDGKVLISGDFLTVNGVLRPYVARLYGDSPAPSLNIARSNAFMIVSWPVTALNFQLQESTDLLLPNSWSPVAQSAVTNVSQISATIPATIGRKFFRLKSQ